MANVDTLGVDLVKVFNESKEKLNRLNKKLM